MLQRRPCGGVALPWLAVALVLLSVVAMCEAATPEAEEAAADTGQEVVELGGDEVTELKQAVEAGRKAVALANTKDSTEAVKVKALASLKLIRSLTAKVHTAIKVPAEAEIVDAAGSTVGDPADEISFPALGIKMDTVDGVGDVDGYEGPKSNTLAAWGSSVARERKKLADEVKKETSGEMSSFGNLEKVLSRNGITDPVFGKTRAKTQDMDEHKVNVQAETDKEITDAEALLAKSTETVGIVKEAVKQVVEMGKSEGQERLKAQKARHEEASKVEEASVKNADAWDAISQNVKDFNKEHQLAEHSTSQSVDEIERQHEALSNLDAADPVESVEDDRKVENAKKIVEEEKEKSRKDAQDEVEAGKQGDVEKELERAKDETRSHAEKAATDEASTDVEKNVDNLEKQEQDDTAEPPNDAEEALESAKKLDDQMQADAKKMDVENPTEGDKEKAAEPEQAQERDESSDKEQSAEPDQVQEPDEPSKSDESSEPDQDYR